jgi:adenosylcobinamide amidohydrolase
MELSLEHRDEAGVDLPVLVWRLAAPARVLSSAPHGGGLGLRSWVLNAQVPIGYARLDPSDHIAEIAATLGLTAGGVGLLTGADVRRYELADDDGVRVAATVGLGQPEWAAAPERAVTSTVGTINVLTWVPEPMADAALVNLIATITEAKVQALLDAGVAGTGTATDAIVVACPPGVPGEPFGGPRSRWGARVARAVHAAVHAGATSWAAG